MQDHGNWGLRMKYCDLVMKGGITSGLVYPNAVLALTREFRFKNIGGTSAGAIAAAITAAAAYGDRQKRSSELPGFGSPKIGFAGLEGVAKKFTAEGFIFGLFPPAAGARNAYRLLVTLTGEGSQLMKVATMLIAVLIIAPIEAVLTLATFLGLGLWIDGFLSSRAHNRPRFYSARFFRIASDSRIEKMGQSKSLEIHHHAYLGALAHSFKYQDSWRTLQDSKS